MLVTHDVPEVSNVSSGGPAVTVLHTSGVEVGSRRLAAVSEVTVSVHVQPVHVRTVVAEATAYPVAVRSLEACELDEDVQHIAACLLPEADQSVDRLLFVLRKGSIRAHLADCKIVLCFRQSWLRERFGMTFAEAAVIGTQMVRMLMNVLVMVVVMRMVMVVVVMPVVVVVGSVITLRTAMMRSLRVIGVVMRLMWSFHMHVRQSFQPE